MEITAGDKKNAPRHSRQITSSPREAECARDRRAIQFIGFKTMFKSENQ